MVGPSGVAVHAAKDETQFFVGASAEILIQRVDMGPELQRKPEDLEDVAVHAASGPFSIADEGLQFFERVDLLCGISVDEVQAPIDGVTVGIDKPGEEALS